MQWAVSLVLAAASGLALGDDCAYPRPGDRLTPAWDCCEAGDINFLLPEDLMKNVKICLDEYPLPDKPLDREEFIKNGPSAEIRNVIACRADCVFSKTGLMTSDKKLDKEAISKMIGSITDNSKDWANAIPKILDYCFESYRSEIDDSLECKGGAQEFEVCVMRESFLQCPESLWNDQPSCTELKNRIEKCPKLPVMMFKSKH